MAGLSFRLWGDDGNYYFSTHLDSYGPVRGHVPVAILDCVGDTATSRGRIRTSTSRSPTGRGGGLSVTPRGRPTQLSRSTVLATNLAGDAPQHDCPRSASLELVLQKPKEIGCGVVRLIEGVSWHWF